MFFNKIFNENMWELLKCIQFLCVRLDFKHIALNLKVRFITGLNKSTSLVHVFRFFKGLKFLNTFKCTRD